MQSQSAGNRKSSDWYIFETTKKFFLSEEKEPSFVSKVTHIKTGNGEWGSRLLKGFESIDSQLIIYMQEDFWPKKDSKRKARLKNVCFPQFLYHKG